MWHHLLASSEVSNVSKRLPVNFKSWNEWRKMPDCRFLGPKQVEWKSHFVCRMIPVFLYCRFISTQSKQKFTCKTILEFYQNDHSSETLEWFCYSAELSAVNSSQKTSQKTCKTILEFYWNDHSSEILQSFWFDCVDVKWKQRNTGIILHTKRDFHSTCLGPKTTELLLTCSNKKIFKEVNILTVSSDVRTV